MKTGLIAGIVAVCAAGAVEAAFVKTENGMFQFCTTKAYGWPAPWKIEYCECEGAKTIFPATSKIVNVSTIAGSGIAGFVLFAGISFRRRQAEEAEQTPP